MSEPTVIYIAGMHRSGTSMVARLLNLCGLDLGPEQELMPASPANPEGYWESMRFFQINERILAHFGGSWDVVPFFPPDWANDPGLDSIRNEARALADARSAPVWGWKDPRNSLLYPFWASIIPGLRPIICLRNPLEVSASLNKRGATSAMFGLRLWWQYSMAMLQQMPSDCLVTHYDAYFHAPADELRRVTHAMGMHVDDATLTAAIKAIGPDLRHSHYGLFELIEKCPVEAIVQTYCRSLLRAGDLMRGMQPDWAAVERYAAGWTPDCWDNPDLARARRAELQLAGAQARVRSIEAELEHSRSQTQVAEAAHAITASQLRDTQQTLAATAADRDALRLAAQRNTEQISLLRKTLAAALRRARRLEADLAEVGQVREQLAGRLQQALAEVAALADERRALVQQLEAARFELTRQQALERDLVHERDETLARLRAHDQATLQLQQRLAEVQRIRMDLEEHLDGILRSRSWKILHAAGIVTLPPRS